MATRKAKAESSSGTNFDYEKAIRAVEISHKLTTTELSKDAYRACAISTGCLMQDLMFGGGIQPAWNTIWGGEGSAKTTTVQSISANILDSSVPFFGYFDYEQALDVEYFSNILSIINNNASYDKIFGIRNLKDPSKWDIAPRIRYYPHDVGEDFYLSMGDLLRSLPDKIYMQKKWWYVFDNTKTGRANAGPNYDKRLYQKEKRFYVEAQDGGRLQALMIIDSIQAMNPENQETGDLKKAMAQDARMHATHLKKVRSKLRRKHCAVLAIGQLRVNPGQMFGNPEYSSGGNTIKHAADVRQKHVARSSPNGGGPVEREASVLAEGGEDAYKYIHVKNEKNKFFTPHTEGWLRVWIDHEGNGRGFDPVYDCYMYLRSVGRIIGKLGVGKGEVTKTMIIDWPENGFYKRKITWLDFKALVLFGIFPENIDDLKQTLISLNFKLKGEEKYHNPKIRERCFAEIRDGSAFEAFQQVRAGLYDQDAVEGEDDDEEEDLDLDDEEDEDDDY